jgi:hypothetical protein
MGTQSRERIPARKRFEKGFSNQREGILEPADQRLGPNGIPSLALWAGRAGGVSRMDGHVPPRIASALGAGRMAGGWRQFPDCANVTGAGSRIECYSKNEPEEVR